MTNVGDTSRCMKCGKKIIVIRDMRIGSGLRAGLWIHAGTLRRAFQTHIPVPPS
jgi:hypothetical protein